MSQSECTCFAVGAASPVLRELDLCQLATTVGLGRMKGVSSLSELRSGPTVASEPAGAASLLMRLGSLAPVLAPAAVLSILVGLARPLVVPDTWIALVSGREIAKHGLPTVEHLTYLAQEHRWVDQQWLAQLALYAAARVGGVGLAIAICVLAVVLAFALAALAAHQRGASPLVILLFFFAAFLAGPWGDQARTQALALPLFGLTLWLLSRDPDLRLRSTLWLLPVLCLWANVHGSVLVGAALVGASAVQALIRTGRRRLPLTLLVLSPAAVLASPYAAGLPGYYRMMIFDAPFGREIDEWRHTVPSQQTSVFFALAAVALTLALWRRRRIRLVDLLLLAITLVAALSAIRLTTWFGLAALAVLPPLATRAPSTARVAEAGAPIVAAVAIALALAGAGAAALRPHEASSAPRTLSVIRAHAGDGRVFANLEVSDWLLWHLPELRGRVAYDARLELLTRQQFNDVFDVARLAPGWQRLVRGYRLIVTTRGTAARIVATGQWRRVYTDASLAVLRSTSP
jgi:hypothetical protein